MAAPLLVGLLIVQGYAWYPYFTMRSANEDLVGSILKNYALGINYGEPMPVGVDHVIVSADVLLTTNEAQRLKQLRSYALSDDQSRICDVFGTPLRARRGTDWLEVRSAGVDHRMDTEDDYALARPAPLVTDQQRAPSLPTTAPRSDDRGASVEQR